LSHIFLQKHLQNYGKNAKFQFTRLRFDSIRAELSFYPQVKSVVRRTFKLDSN